MQGSTGGFDVRTRTSHASQNRSCVRDLAVADEPVGIPISRRAGLMGASALAGGGLRGLAIAAGMVAVFGGAPAFAACCSTNTGTPGTCAATLPSAVNSEAVGRGARAN